MHIINEKNIFQAAINRRQSYYIIFYICLFSFFVKNKDIHAQTHFQLPFSTSDHYIFCNYLGNIKINGIEARIGDEVAFFDPEGTLCGVYTVNIKGQYGIVHIYGDRLYSVDIDEGAIEGEILTVRVWDSDADKEYKGNAIFLSSGVAEGYVSSHLPPVWSTEVAGYVLDIDVVADYNDINNSIKCLCEDKNGCFFQSVSEDFGVNINLK